MYIKCGKIERQCSIRFSFSFFAFYFCIALVAVTWRVIFLEPFVNFESIFPSSFATQQTFLFLEGTAAFESVAMGVKLYTIQAHTFGHTGDTLAHLNLCLDNAVAHSLTSFQMESIRKCSKMKNSYNSIHKRRLTK